MDQGFWGVVEKFLGAPDAVLRVPVKVVRVHLASRGFTISEEYIEQLLLEDSVSAEPNLRWSVSKASDGKLVFTPR